MSKENEQSELEEKINQMREKIEQIKREFEWKLQNEIRMIRQEINHRLYEIDRHRVHR